MKRAYQTVSERRYAQRNALRQAAQGRWPEILRALGIDARHLRDQHGPCPGCGGTKRFRFDDREGRGTYYCNDSEPPAGDGFALLQHVFGWTFPEALKRVAEIVGVERARSTPKLRALVTPHSAPAENERARLRIKHIYSTCRIIEPGGDVMRYLSMRGLSAIERDLPDDLFEHPLLAYFDKQGRRDMSAAMVAVLRTGEGRFVNLHRTYIREGRKAFGRQSRKLCPSIQEGDTKGAAIRLYPATDRLALTEGIENALAVRLATPDWPVWSCWSASGLASVVLPKEVREVAIWADHDGKGLEAAQALQARLIDEGRSARLVIPPEPGMDACDWLRCAQKEAI